MVSMDGSRTLYFYLHLLIIQDLGVLLHFMLFKADFLATANVSPSQVTPNVLSVIKGFIIICQRLEVFPIVRVYFSFYGTKIRA